MPQRYLDNPPAWGWDDMIREILRLTWEREEAIRKNNIKRGSVERRRATNPDAR